MYCQSGVGDWGDQRSLRPVTSFGGKQHLEKEPEKKREAESRSSGLTWQSQDWSQGPRAAGQGLGLSCLLLFPHAQPSVAVSWRAVSRSFPGAGPPAPWRCWNTSVCPCLVPTGSGGKAQGGTQAGVSHLQPRLEASSPSPPPPTALSSCGVGERGLPSP